MANRQRTAAQRIADRLIATASDDIAYQRNGSTIIAELPATLGRSDHERKDADGFVHTVQSRDFIVRTADLIADSGGAAITPERGDTIVWLGTTYTVLPFGGNDDTHRPSDPFGIMTRIHTKQV